MQVALGTERPMIPQQIDPPAQTRFRKILDRGVHEEIARLRIERVKRRLVESNARVKIIAREAGFADSTRMSIVFRRIEGISPTAYRKQRRGC